MTRPCSDSGGTLYCCVCACPRTAMVVRILMTLAYIADPHCSSTEVSMSWEAVAFIVETLRHALEESEDPGGSLEYDGFRYSGAQVLVGYRYLAGIGTKRL